MGMQERVEIVPPGGNPDRKYYRLDNWFIKVDDNVQRGQHEAAWMSEASYYSAMFPKLISSEVLDNGKHELVMTYMPGETLERLALTDTERAIVVCGLYCIAGALVEAGIVHGDINVSNVLYDRDRKRVSLIDWEMAREMREGEELYDMVAPPWGIVRTINMLKSA